MTYEEFKLAFKNFLETFIFSAEKSRHEGLLALENDLLKHEDEYNARDIFWYGMRFAVDGIDDNLTDRILSNIIEQENSGYKKTLMQIKKEAILSIQRGDNPRITIALLNSYTDLHLDDPIMKVIDGR